MFALDNRKTASEKKFGRPISAVFLALCMTALGGNAWANGILDVYPDPQDPFSSRTYVFPNWKVVPTASYMIYDCEDSVCSDCTNSELVSMTIMNYGTASGGAGGDITNVYFQIICGSKIDTGLVTMNYAGVWNGQAAWVWSGLIDMENPCGDCLCYPSLFLYTDISPCPTDGATIELSPRFDELATDPYHQGLLDSCGYTGPSSLALTDRKIIKYVVKKVDKEAVAPGDLMSYSLYYGRPGTGTVYTIWITDSLPDYTHFCDPTIKPECSCTIMPDSGWAPAPGPPMKLRWTLGPFPTEGGPTGYLNFQLTPDWGNPDWNEPDSGDVAIPEGEFIFNSAHMSWDSGTGCTPGRVSNVTSTVIKRFLFWKIGDNDMLYAPDPSRLSQDKITYSLFIKNVSNKKTWWDVTVWDTVPQELDVWGEPGLGMYDPCVGWTMTPSGCAPGGAGKIVAGGNTIVTWKLDLPPSATITLLWKARVSPAATSGSTAINRASVLALGKTGIEGGTGHSKRPRSFTHEASILLKVMYVSYVGWAADRNDWYDPSDQVYWIAFYPLNLGTNFTLWKKWCCPAAPCDLTCEAFAEDGGISPVISDYAGDCESTDPNWEAGCGGTRAPARFVPVDFRDGVIPDYPFNLLHKLVANSPVIWELAVKLNDWNQDANTFAGTTSLTFSGYMAYTYCRIVAYPNTQDTLYTINTNENMPTTVHIFKWNPGPPGRWDYASTGDIYNESQWAYVPLEEGHYRLISSDTRMIVYKGFPGMTLSGSYNDFGTPGPNRENGNLVSSTVPATFYLYAGHLGRGAVAIIGNVSETVEGTYEIWRYSPMDPTAVPQSVNISTDLTGMAGYWTLVKPFDTVSATFGGPGNPDVYGSKYDESIFTTRFRLYKVIVKGGEGASFMTYAGRDIFAPYSGGSMVHASKDEDGLPGAQSGREFWIHMTNGSSCSKGNEAVQTFDVFCPKVNMHIVCEAPDGYSAHYVTTDIDQCVSFKSLTAPSAPNARNWKIRVEEGPGTNPGDVMVQYIMCQIAEKFYTAPFLKQGVFYSISAPPVVFAGQKFCITVVVSDTGGGTKTDYCGETDFTSSDPKATLPYIDANKDAVWCSSLAVGLCDPTPSCPDTSGVQVFCDISLQKVGLQSIVATDVNDGTVTGLGVVMVVGADIKFTKTPQLSVASSGDMVQFRLCWSNYSSATAFWFTITDAVPMGTKLVPGQTADDTKCDIPAGVTVDVAYSDVTPPAFNTTTAGLPFNTRWLMWTVKHVGINTSGCVCFKVTVD